MILQENRRLNANVKIGQCGGVFYTVHGSCLMYDLHYCQGCYQTFGSMLDIVFHKDYPSHAYHHECYEELILATS